MTRPFTVPLLSTTAALLLACASSCTIEVQAPVEASPGASDEPGTGEPDRPGIPLPPPSAEVTVNEVPGLPGSRLLVRGDAIPAPGIVALHGSEGGTARYIDEEATVLAEAGFAVLTFCWFDCPGKPSAIHRIALEDTLAAIDWLGRSNVVQGRPVGVFGVSRGAEQAVLLASLVGDTNLVAAVAVHAASDTVVASWDPAAEDSVYEEDPATGQRIYGPAWTWQGQPLYGETTSFWEPGPRIRAEDYPGSLYLSHGAADQLWPASRSRNIEAARDRAGLPTEPHYWQGEDHILMQPENVAAYLETLTAFFVRELRT